MAIDFDAYDANRPVPPDTLFKYLHPDRIDVLNNGLIRFTPPLNTNDIFEVRQAFELFCGPKLKELFEEEGHEIDVDAILNEQLIQSELPFSLAEVKSFIDARYGMDAQTLAQIAWKKILADEVYPMMNSPEVVGELLERLGSRMLCLSLAEKMDSSPMWAHYADNSKGFVIAFNTDQLFFGRGDDTLRSHLHKITYFDGQMPEMIDDPYVALISKQADWAYEREWRLYKKVENAKRIIPTDDGGIHLMDFPSEIVSRVILGIRASAKLESELKSILADRYPNVQLSKVVPDRTTATLSEVPV